MNETKTTNSFVIKSDGAIIVLKWKITRRIIVAAIAVIILAVVLFFRHALRGTAPEFVELFTFIISVSAVCIIFFLNFTRVIVFDNVNRRIIKGIELFRIPVVTSVPYGPEIILQLDSKSWKSDSGSSIGDISELVLGPDDRQMESVAYLRIVREENGRFRVITRIEKSKNAKTLEETAKWLAEKTGLKAGWRPFK
ncbi:MAG: hypothetical protein ACYS8W_12815 [Planctomycetota bacterium]|jgi:hypothetical protein